MLSSLDTVLGLGDDTLLWPGEVPFLLLSHFLTAPAAPATGPEGVPLHLQWLLGASSSHEGRAPFILEYWLGTRLYFSCQLPLTASPRPPGSPVGPGAAQRWLIFYSQSQEQKITSAYQRSQ